MLALIHYVLVCTLERGTKLSFKVQVQPSLAEPWPAVLHWRLLHFVFRDLKLPLQILDEAGIKVRSARLQSTSATHVAQTCVCQHDPDAPISINMQSTLHKCVVVDSFMQHPCLAMYIYEELKHA